MATLRFAEKFTDPTGSATVFTFPLNLYEWESDAQGLSIPAQALAGANYDYDLLGSSLAPKRNAVESVRFLIKGTASEIEGKVDEARQECYRIGRGKLWVRDSTTARRWAWARADEVPGFRIDNPFVVPMSIPFARFSDWYGETQTDTTVAMNEATETFTIANAGNARVFNAVFLLKGTFVNPRIENTTSGYVLQSTRDGSAAGHWLRFDCGKRRVEFSSNGGASYSGDYANFVRQTAQVHMMVLEPGNNSFEVTFGDVPSGTLTYQFYPAYH